VLLVSATLYVFYTMKAAALKIQKIQEIAGKLNPSPAPEKVPEVKVNEGPTWPPYLARGGGSVGGAIVIAGVIPFLMFFMLIRKDHVYEWLCGRAVVRGSRHPRCGCSFYAAEDSGTGGLVAKSAP